MGAATLAVFLAEVRTARRLARTWMLGVLAVGTTLVGYVFFAQLHGQASSFLPSAVTSPRFLVGAYGGYLLWLLMGATVFLSFDLGNREQRERINDVLDSRPVSNIQLLAGRLVGVIATLAVPMLAAFVLIQGIGTLGQALDWPVRATLEPVSLAVFLVADALPALLLWGAAVFLLATALRNRLAVVVGAFALLALGVWGLGRAPAWLLAIIALAPDRLVSDLVTSIPNAATFVQRGGGRRRCRRTPGIRSGVPAAARCHLARPLLGRGGRASRQRCGRRRRRHRSGTRRVGQAGAMAGKPRVLRRCCTRHYVADGRGADRPR